MHYSVESALFQQGIIGMVVGDGISVFVRNGVGVGSSGISRAKG